MNKILTITHTLALSSTLPGSLPHVPANASSIKILLGIMFGLIGALSVLFIVISGLRFIIANGDPQKTARAREGIIFAVVGIIIALTAEAIVAFVIGNT